MVLIIIRSQAHVKLGGDTVGGRTSQGVAAEGAGVISRLEHICSLFAEHRANRYTTAQRLRQHVEHKGKKQKSSKISCIAIIFGYVKVLPVDNVFFKHKLR